MAKTQKSKKKVVVKKRILIKKRSGHVAETCMQAKKGIGPIKPLLPLNDPGPEKRSLDTTTIVLSTGTHQRDYSREIIVLSTGTHHRN